MFGSDETQNQNQANLTAQPVTMSGAPDILSQPQAGIPDKVFKPGNDDGLKAAQPPTSNAPSAPPLTSTTQRDGGVIDNPVTAQAVINSTELETAANDTPADLDKPLLEPKIPPPKNISPSVNSTSSTSGTGAPPSDPLLKIKQDALQNLAPLIGQLDQAPEEKFKTLMMLIRASDNSDLVQTAFEEANKITDQKTRAQALLDVVNEINYFTKAPEAK